MMMDWTKLAARAITALERIADALEARALVGYSSDEESEPEVSTHAP